MHRFIQDLRYASRGLIKTPLFTIGVVLTLALGIGVNATMFGVVDTLFLRPPTGVKDPGGIVRVYYRQHFDVMGTFTGSSTSYPSFTDLRDHVPGFAQVAAVTTRPLGLGRGADAIQVVVAAVSHQYFPMLGVQPVRGRFFTAAEDQPSGERVAVLSYGFWQRHFGADASVVGRTLPLGKGTYTVIGIAPPGFGGLDIKPVDLFLPINPAAQGDVITSEAIASYNWTWMSVVARLKPGVPAATAAAQATLAYRQGVSAGRNRKDSTTTVVLGPIQEARAPETSSGAKVALWIGVVAAVVLLIACANVANLLLARGVSRRRELAVRASLGAGRAGLMRALLSESLVLALMGGASAILLSLWVGSAARGFLLPGLPAEVPLVESRVLMFTGIAVAFTALLTGLVPAMQASRTDLVAALKRGGHGTTAHGGRTRSALLVVQIALTLVLLVGAGLFVRSLRKVQGIDLGFDADRVTSVQLNLASAGFSSQQANDVYLRLLDRFRQLPGVQDAAVSMGTPFNYSYSVDVHAEGADSIPQVKSGGPYIQAISPGYMATMGTRLVTGRDFTAGDVAGSVRVALVDATFAKLVWPRGNAVGKCLYIGADSVKTCTRVVGIVADAKRGEVTETESMLYYVPFAQYQSDAAISTPTINAIFVRTRPGDHGTPGALQREIQAVGNLPFAQVQTIADQAAPQLRSWRLGASAFSAFGLLALLIAATGIFAVLSYSVSQRTKEIGVRVALGAQSSHVVSMIVRQGLGAALIGTLLGTVGAYALGRAIASLLYQVPATDPLVFCGVIAMLFSVAAVASYLPARRASRVAPMTALRSE